MFPIFDLHCDFPLFLAMDPKRTPFDPVSRCSIRQLEAGNVKLQTMVIFSETKVYSVILGKKAWESFLDLPKKYPQHFSFFNGELTDKISLIAAIENASAICSEDEPLQKGIDRLDQMLKQAPVFYISLTWNDENRFGGGAESSVGLKNDGIALLDHLSGKGLAIDLSHTSDRLATDILNIIERKHFELSVIASHSNFRSIVSQPRNLPDEIAKEIIYRQGLIGMNFYGKFLKTAKTLYKHIEYGLKLGGEEALCFGADFFCDSDFPHLDYRFLEGLQDASVYPNILNTLEKQCGLSKTQIEAIAYKNALNFLSARILKPMQSH